MCSEREGSHLSGVKALADWLRGQGLDLSNWGLGKAKSVEDLWREITAEDCSLSPGPTRSVVLAVILIEDKNRLLCEAKQELRDGRIRLRSKPPREKVRRGEKIIAGVMRCLEQELRISPDVCRIVSIPERPIRVARESDSYPGLRTVYLEYWARVAVPNLPREDFCTEESGDPHDPVFRHWWTWVDREAVSLPPSG